LAENCYFFLTLSDLAPSLAMFPLEFRSEVNHEETRVMGLLPILQWRPHHCSILTQGQRVTDSQTDRQRDLLYSTGSEWQAMLTRCKKVQARWNWHTQSGQNM